MTLVTGLLLEVSLRAGQAAGVFQSRERVIAGEPFYQDVSRAWGVWHPVNARFIAHGDCFEHTYESNSYGARDLERPRESAAPRVLVLGDSFVEGVGSAFGSRMTDRLEAATGVAHLNFGTAGGFSSVQQWQLYEHLASQFDHSLVLLFHFPNNDFLENDLARWWDKDRYRPYLRRDAHGQFELYYPVDYEEARARERGQLRWNRAYNALFVYRFGAWLEDQVAARRALAMGETTELGYVGYVNYSEEDLARLFFSYRKLRDAAGGREVVIFSLPRQHELEYARRHSTAGALPKRLAEFAASEPHVRYFDLQPGFLADAGETGRDLGEYFIPCDGHWSDLGNEVAARIVAASVDYAALASPPVVAGR